MTSPLFKEISAGINELDLDDRAKEVLRAYLRGVRMAHGDGSSIEREERQAFATGLLANRVPRSEIRERLISRFDISRSHAYRVIDEALNLKTVP